MTVQERETRMRRTRSVRRPVRRLLLVAVLMAVAAPVSAQWLLVPMDRGQANHLRAYGLTYWSLEHQEKAEWLLNYRGGSFLLPDRDDIRREAAFRGVSIEPMNAPV